jgi:hypothetical protein
MLGNKFTPNGFLPIKMEPFVASAFVVRLILKFLLHLLAFQATK